jgi:hypothetical protein
MRFKAVRSFLQVLDLALELRQPFLRSLIFFPLQRLPFDLQLENFSLHLIDFDRHAVDLNA